MTFYSYDPYPTGHLIEWHDRFIEMIFDAADEAPMAMRDDGPIGPVWWCGPGPMTPEMRAAGWIDMTTEDDGD